MRVPLAWLRDYCDPGLPAEDLADRLNLTGTEVGRIERAGVASTDAFVVGKVLSAERHPDADRLTVCKVDDGGGEPRTIVCGAPNVAGGQTVAVARPGATMPDGSKLGEAKLRGVLSSGMILAEDEVGVGEDHGGIMVLPDELPAGAPLVEHLQIADDVLELEVSPNRPDCLAVYGVAREVHAATGASLAADPADDDAEPAGEDSAEDHASVEIDPEICRRFTARVFEDVKFGPSPLWLKARLTAAGQRPISNVVDITNYVMLLTGQPLHAFDLDEVRGRRIVVRRAKPGERMRTLDGVDRELAETMALVCDAEGPSGIAGVMGGEISEVSGKTTRVLMEAATWVGTNILQTSSALALRTEASARFEKRLHPHLAIAAQRMAARLMVELCGARLVPGTIDVYPEPAEDRRVTMRLARATRLLGEEIPGDQASAILGRLGFEVDARDGELAATVPHWRDSDVQREADLIEEVARIHGLDKLPTTLPRRERAVGRLTPAQRLRRRLEDALRDRGMHEIVAWSFTSPATLAALRLAGEPALAVANPLSEDQSVMRPLLLPGLLDAARRNAAHDRAAVRLFESAHVYAPGGSPAGKGSPDGALPAREGHRIGGLITEAAPESWQAPASEPDFYAARALVEAALGSVGAAFAAVPAARPFLHPGRTAALELAGRGIGWVGELHPLVARAWDIEAAAAFELDFDAIAELARDAAAYRDVSTFPAVLQDLAVVVGEDTPAAEVDAAVREGAGPMLQRISMFDLYRGEQVGEGNKSLALRVEFRAPDRTLTEDEVAGLRSEIESALARIGGRLRA